MTWLGEWLREIILVVLLASFVEMLLPSKSMERYARLVLSLLVLLTILSPIISLLKGDAITELSLAMDEQNLQSGSPASEGQRAGSLKKILEDGQKLAHGQQEQSLKLAAIEIAGQMKEQISAETGERGVQVTVTLAMQKADNPDVEALPAISSVRVLLPEPQAITTGSDASDEAAGGGKGSVMDPIVIPPVNTIDIEIKNSEAEEQEQASMASTEAVTRSTDTAEPPIHTKAIVTLLEQKWGLEAENIQVLSGFNEAAKL